MHYFLYLEVDRVSIGHGIDGGNDGGEAHPLSSWAQLKDARNYSNGQAVIKRMEQIKV